MIEDASPQNIWRSIQKTCPIHILGGVFFKFRLKKSINAIKKDKKDFFHNFPAFFFIASERVHLDEALAILYVDRRLNSVQIKSLLLGISSNRPIDELYVFRTRQSFFSKLHRRFLRRSIEKYIESSAVKIAKTPPRGKVATEDQHFLLTMMRLKVFIKQICRKVEKRSAIDVLNHHLKLHKKNLRKKQRTLIRTENKIELVEDQQVISGLESLIFDKQLLLQKRMIRRVLSGIQKWQADQIETERNIILELKRDHIDRKIKHTQEKLSDIHNNPVALIQPLLQKFYEKRLIKLKRDRIKINYLVRLGDKQNDFLHRMQQYFEEFQRTSLIPTSFLETINLHAFNILRYTFNFLFIALYAYLLQIPIQILPFFLALGMFVFQPVSNKFAVLFMLPFVKTHGLKRLTYPELDKEIKKRAGAGFYFCAIDLPLFTGKSSELETTIHYINRNINNLRNTLSHFKKLALVYQITSNTVEMGLIHQEIEVVKSAQKAADKLLGRSRIFFLYLHRKSSTAKKVGNIIAAHLFKYHGVTDSTLYTDSTKFLSTFDNGNTFDYAFGDFAGSLFFDPHKKQNLILTNEIIKKRIMVGEKIPIAQKVDFTFFVDNKNEIKPASLEKGLAIMLHPDNSSITILQPEMSIEDPIHEGLKITSAFLRMLRIARDTHNFRYLKTLHGIYQNMSAYYGKGMIRLAGYDYMIMNEVLNLKYVDSHDWQESVFNYAVFSARSDKRIQVKYLADKQLNMLMETENESHLYHLSFQSQKSCLVTDAYGNQRNIELLPASMHDQIWQVVDYLDNNVDVGERELISTIGNYIRDTRWLKGDLQMFNTFYPYARYMPPYHKFHLGNIFRRFTNELALLIWVLMNFVIMLVVLTPSVLESQMVFFLSLHLVITAFGFAGIDLFLYPISFELRNTIHGIPRNYIKTTLSSIIQVFKKIFIGLWQFPLYLLIAWPRILLGASSSLRIVLSGIDQSVNWGAESNASISAEEVSETGIPFLKFMRNYLVIMLIGLTLWVSLLTIIVQQYAYSSVLNLFNMGIIVISLILGPFVSFAVSRKIKVE